MRVRVGCFGKRFRRGYAIVEAGDAKTLMNVLMRHVAEKTTAWGVAIEWVEIELLSGERGTKQRKEARTELAAAIYDAVRGGGFGGTDVHLRS